MPGCCGGLVGCGGGLRLGWAFVRVFGCFGFIGR